MGMAGDQCGVSSRKHACIYRRDGEQFRSNALIGHKKQSLTYTYYLQGWPTESMTAANATLGAAVAGVAELQTCMFTLEGYSPPQLDGMISLR
jgi:hypothetical protein